MPQITVIPSFARSPYPKLYSNLDYWKPFWTTTYKNLLLYLECSTTVFRFVIFRHIAVEEAVKFVRICQNSSDRRKPLQVRRHVAHVTHSLNL